MANSAQISAHLDAKVHVQTVALLAQVTVQADVTGYANFRARVLARTDVTKTVKVNAQTGV